MHTFNNVNISIVETVLSDLNILYILNFLKTLFNVVYKYICILSFTMLCCNSRMLTLVIFECSILAAVKIS